MARTVICDVTTITRLNEIICTADPTQTFEIDLPGQIAASAGIAVIARARSLDGGGRGSKHRRDSNRFGGTAARSGAGLMGG